jgi:hypothetical protein
LNVARTNSQDLSKFLTNIAIGFGVLVECSFEDGGLLSGDSSTSTRVSISLTSNENVFSAELIVECHWHLVWIHDNWRGLHVLGRISRYELHDSICTLASIGSTGLLHLKQPHVGKRDEICDGGTLQCNADNKCNQCKEKMRKTSERRDVYKRDMRKMMMSYRTLVGQS